MIRWDFVENPELVSKITIQVALVRPFKESFFGIRNDPSGLGYVPDAVEVSGFVVEGNNDFPEEEKVVILIPEHDMRELHVDERLVLWLSDKHKCFKYEVV